MDSHNRPLDPIYPLLLCDIMQCPFTQSQVTTEQALLAFLRETLTNSHVSSWWSQLNVLDSTGENHLWRLLQLLYDQTCMNAEIHPHHEDLWIWECLILPFVVWLSKQYVTPVCITKFAEGFVKGHTGMHFLRRSLDPASNVAG